MASGPASPAMATAREEDTGGRTITPPRGAAHPAPAASGAVTPGAAVLRAEGDRGGIPPLIENRTVEEGVLPAVAALAGTPLALPVVEEIPAVAAAQAAVAAWADTGEPDTLTR